MVFMDGKHTHRAAMFVAKRSDFDMKFFVIDESYGVFAALVSRAFYRYISFTSTSSLLIG